MSCKFM